MRVYNNLKFRDSRDKRFAEAEIGRFIKNFFGEIQDKYNYVEITKDNIYLQYVGESGISTFTFYGFKPSTAKEMLIYLTALNNSEFTKSIYKKD
mgnify:CR=1